jgi:hypothetical protein
MGIFIHKNIFALVLVSCLPNLFVSACDLLPSLEKNDTVLYISRNYEKDTNVEAPIQIMKICSCQILDLQSSNHRQRNIALLAERSKSRNLSYDINRITRVMGKEKKHMQSFFYDKLTVTNSFTERTDCRSLYLKLKRKNKYLILYDILDADARR